MFKENKTYNIKLLKKIGEGSYGIIYLSNNKSITLKILLYDDKPLLEDNNRSYNEYDLVEEFINKKLSFNQIFALAENINTVKVNSITFKKGTKIFFMPYLISIYDYYQVIGKHFFSKEIYLLKYMKKICEIHKEIEKMDYLNLDLKGGNIMINANEELVLIDYGFFIKYEPNKYFKPKVEYYCWCFDKIKQDELHSFLIGVFILEIIYDKSIYHIKNRTELITLIEKEEFKKSYSDKFRNLLRKCFFKGVNLDEFENEINKIMELGNTGDRKNLATLYSYICEKKQIEDYNYNAYD